MELNRAQEIIQSKQKIDVQIDGTSVWIEEVDTRSGTARVYTEGNPQDKRTVAVDELQEMH